VVRGGAREFSPVMQRVLERLAPKLAAHHDAPELPNTCLINCYGREMSRLPDGREQPALFEFVDGAKPDEPSCCCGSTLRRVSVSFRCVPETHIKDLHEYSAAAQAQSRGDVEQLAQRSLHCRAQLVPPVR
jgi:hypothetical protein